MMKLNIKSPMIAASNILALHIIVFDAICMKYTVKNTNDSELSRIELLA